MKNKIRRTITISFMVLGMFLLLGFGTKSVELLNNSLLIDLDKAISLSSIGNEGNEDNSFENVEPVKAKTYVISIRDTRIKFGGEVIADASVLKERLAKNFSSGDSVRLVDDFAEAHVYREVLGVLDELSQSEGFTYSEY